MSRVGGSAQIRAMRKVAGRLKLELAQYRDLEAFAQFGSELDAATQRSWPAAPASWPSSSSRPYAPWPVEEQVAIIYAANQGYLDRIDVAEVPKVNERDPPRAARASGEDLLAEHPRHQGPLRRDGRQDRRDRARSVVEQFAPSEGPCVEAAVEAAEAEEARGRRGREATETAEESAGATAS